MTGKPPELMNKFPKIPRKTSFFRRKIKKFEKIHKKCLTKILQCVIMNIPRMGYIFLCVFLNAINPKCRRKGLRFMREAI